MKNLETLINELCPEGVEFVKLGDVFDLFSGMSKVSNKWAESGNCKFIDYLNIYNNLNVDVTKLQNATVASFKQNVLAQGDILFTCASETPRECAISAVIREPIAKNTFLDDHLNGIRVKEECKERVNPAFVNYYFYSPKFRVAICKIVRGVTRFYIVNKNFLKIEIPLPPIEVQTEIVRILDKFTSLEAELEAELDCRKRQYEYYRDKLLSVDNVGGQEVEWKKIGEICDTLSGFPFDSSKFQTSGIKLMRGKNVKRGYFDFNEDDDRYWESPDGLEKYLLQDKDIIISMDGSLVGKSFAMLSKKHLPLLLVQRVARVRAKRVNPNFLFHNIAHRFSGYVDKKKTGGAIPHVSMKDIQNFSIPVTSLQEQERIATILDRFESLTTSLQSGLPAEITARRQQYEHYRDKLLTFKRKGAA